MIFIDFYGQGIVLSFKEFHKAMYSWKVSLSLSLSPSLSLSLGLGLSLKNQILLKN
jgi:hypothetical protein